MMDESILSFLDEIFREKLFHHVGPEKIDGTHVTDVVPVCELRCYVEILPKLT